MATRCEGVSKSGMSKGNQCLLMVINGDFCNHHKGTPAVDIHREVSTRCLAFCYGKKRKMKQCKNTVIAGKLCYLHNCGYPQNL